jgi:hypothetical protein
MKKWHVFMVPVLLIYCCGCSRNDLSRPKAAELIAIQQKLPIVQTTVFGKYVKKSWSDPSWMPAVCMYNENDYAEAQPRLASWASKGLITISESEERKGECHYLWVNTNLTNEGRKYLVKESGGVHEVKIYELAFGEVTGIQINEQFKAAEVEYTLKKVNISPFSGNISMEPIKKRASFALYDDGWRIQGN